ncbi:hypothetical protein GCM10027445_41950 [Amycolatopsis endophytica]|uniref:4-oxalocrotonate tautomerase-like domain-containing protein n=1 Tax=Amycolatopsis endophytica TaxID=860233 RepID=A0A853B724_9PSEU|nr:hypothetical protein [Amycolatopsis endophytica]
MPLVRIDALPTHDDSTLEALGDAVHQAMTGTIGFPEDDLFQVITSTGLLRHGTYPGIRAGTTASCSSASPCGPGAVMRRRRRCTRASRSWRRNGPGSSRATLVCVTENQPVDWSFGEGVAQYLE